MMLISLSVRKSEKPSAGLLLVTLMLTVKSPFMSFSSEAAYSVCGVLSLSLIFTLPKDGAATSKESTDTTMKWRIFIV